jgi:hypothetical protein
MKADTPINSLPSTTVGIPHDTSKDGVSSRLIVPIPLDDFAVSWAGPSGRDDFCFGSEDGKLRFTTVDGESIGGLTSGLENAEAVNGVAFIGDVIAVSTRNEVTFWTVPQSEGKKALRAVFNCGAHGVVATAEGYFFAPLERTGLMKVRASHDEVQPVKISRARHPILDYYKVIGLHSYGRPEVLACAARYGGVAAMELMQEDDCGQISSITFPGLDVVDVCSLGSGVTPPAVAAFGKDGTLVLLRDVLSDRSPVTMKFDEIRGKAYRLFSARGSIFLLTSTGVYVLSALAQRFLRGEPVERTPTAVCGVRLEAVDANLCGERWLLVVMPHGVLRFDLDLLIGSPPASESVEEERPFNPRLIQPAWESHEEAAELMAGSMGTVMAGKGQVGGMIAAAMLLGNDVLDVKRREGGVCFGKKAILTPIPRALVDLQAYRGVH